MKLKERRYIADLRLKYEKWRVGITFVEEISLDVGIASYSTSGDFEEKLEELEAKENNKTEE